MGRRAQRAEGAVLRPVRASARRAAAVRPLVLLLTCLFLSGATGLVYEVVWLRMLGLVFGHTVPAMTTVLAAFMAGLALGSLLFARVASRVRNLIRAYGLLEVGIGLSCALVPLLFEAAAAGYLALFHRLGLAYDTFSAVQFLLLFAVLLVPTMLMGGTLPVLSQALATDDRGLGRTIGVLYAANTFGAVSGVVLAGYVLLPALGTRTVIGLAAAVNLAVGLLAILYSRRHPGDRRPAPPPRPVRDEEPAGAPAPAGGRLRTWAILAALGLSGAVSMGYEVAWTRALSLVIGSSTYAFTSMLVAFLVGIAGGSALFARLAGDGRATPSIFALIQVGIGVAVSLTLLPFDRLPELVVRGLRRSDSPSFVQGLQLLVSAGVLLPSTLLIGATFPCAVALVGRARDAGRDVGRVYAVNTLGAIAGTIAAGFVLIPAVGVHAAIRLGVAVNLLLGAALLAAASPAPSLRRWGGVGAALAAALATVLIPSWDRRMLASGASIYARWYLDGARGTLADRVEGQALLYYKDGASGTIAVTQEGEHRFLKTNGKVDASTAGDMLTQLMAGHLPLLVHPHPRRVLVIGMGSGVTAGAVARHPVERLDIVDIEPAVYEASRFFAEENGRVLQDPRVRTIVADGRNFLLTTTDRYDVIISEPSNPWIGGLASMFSEEFFRLARDRLEPGGLLLQWLQGYTLSGDDLRMVVNTVRTALPATSLWNTVPGDFLLLGKRDPAPLDFTLVKRRYESNAGLRDDLQRLFRIPQSWPGVLGYFMLGEADTATLTRGAGVNTDDRLPLEFSAPRALYTDTTYENWRLIRGFRTADLPEMTAESRRELERADNRYWIGVGYMARQVPADALPHFQRALELDPEHLPSMHAASRAHLDLDQPDEALTLARRVTERAPLNADAHYLAGLAAEALHRDAEAKTFLTRAASLRPQVPAYREAWRRVEGRSAAPSARVGGASHVLPEP